MAGKPAACPDCKFSPVADIIYGEVKPTNAMVQRMHKGEIVLGGCFVIDGAPTWRCSQCGKEEEKAGPI
ncbi:MAG: hypothetical protein COB53_11495 [Elusimicrobia bacterium]|nr:MAG: hypothetical protein COB53_11495 [Elusimicrobiota bacterium]